MCHRGSLILMFCLVSSFSVETYADSIFLDRSSFNTATGGSLSHYGFNSFFSWSPTVDFGDFTVQAGSGDIFTSSAASEGGQSAGFAGSNATISFDNPINSFAIDLVDWGTNPNDFQPPGLRELRVMTNTSAINYVVATADSASGIDGEVRFIGFISDTPFSSVTVSKTTAASDSIGLDNMLFGTTVAVPEPHSIWILSSVLLIGFLRCRSKVQFA